MNFTLDIKKEICSLKTTDQKKSAAALSAFIHTSGVLGEREGQPAFFIVSETEKVAEYFTRIFSDLFGEELCVSRASIDKMSGRGKLVLEYTGENTASILQKLGLYKEGKNISGIRKSLLKSEEEKNGFIAGAFLGGGSCILPNEEGTTGYHLEFAFQSKKTAEDFCDILAQKELLLREVDRPSSFVVYAKNKETISDFLSVIGAKKSLKNFSDFVNKRDESNQTNRAANCFSGNADKAAGAAVKQVLAIRILRQTGKFILLDSSLKETAEQREQNPSLSMQELADLLKITKSCLNHRLRKLSALAVEEKNKNKIATEEEEIND